MKKSKINISNLSIGLPKDIETMQTPFLSLDSSLGGGFGVGRWFEIYGAEGLGKTSLALQIASFLTETDNTFLMICDTESRMNYSRLSDLFYQEDIRIDPNQGEIYANDRLCGILRRPNFDDIPSLFEAFAKECVEQNYHGVIIWDSLVSGTSEKAMQGDTIQVGYKASAIQRLIERFNVTMIKVPLTLFVINQIREKNSYEYVCITKR